MLLIANADGEMRGGRRRVSAADGRKAQSPTLLSHTGCAWIGGREEGEEGAAQAFASAPQGRG